MNEEEITVDEGTRTIASSYYSSFGDGSNLKRIICMAKTPPSCYQNVFPFHGVNKKMCRLYVPKGSLSDYQATAPWSEFLYIREGGYTKPDVSGDIVIDAWEGISEISEIENSYYVLVPEATPLWVCDEDASWGFPNNGYACFTPSLMHDYEVKYHSDEGMAGERYKLRIVFAPETRAEMSQTPCKADITISVDEGYIVLVQKLVISGTEVTTFEADNIVIPKNGIDLFFKTNVRSIEIRREAFSRILRIAEIRLIPEATGVSLIKQTAPATGDCYTIDGRKTAGKPAKKGLYIQNGRKVVVK